ncbi:hypothetical protein HN011_000946 [Eciton burchellii]|nr:hypothetical protein HN011_000946 [Eciton burchellii]
MSFYNNNRYYYLNKVVLSYQGLWPYQSRLESNVLATMPFLFIGSYMALELWGLISGKEDLSIVMENTSPLLIDTFVLLKIINHLYNKSKMKDLLDRIKETWEIIQTGPENEILRNYTEEGRIFSIQYALALYSVCVFYCTMPVIFSGIYNILPINGTYEARFLYRIEHVIDIEKYYNLLMLHTFISVFYIVSITIAVDCLFVFCVQHVCALFENIRINMERIRVLDCVMLKPNIADDEAYNIIIGCIKLYKYALNFSDVLSSAYATIFLFLLGIVMVSLSFSGAELILVDIQLDEMIRIVAAFLAQLIHIYYLSLMSQRLIDHSSGMQEVIYNCDWHAISLRSRQLLRFTLLRATKPCQIKAGKMFVMSMKNFSSLLQTSMSYFMMLMSLQ